jgi:hypothetical protein
MRIPKNDLQSEKTCLSLACRQQRATLLVE